MRLESMHIDGFGIFNDEPIEGIAGGLTVVEGVNEAGKSTLVAFIRAVLFGFEDGRSRRIVTSLFVAAGTAGGFGGPRMGGS